MPSDISDYLARRAEELNVNRGDYLVTIQKYLDSFYPSQTRALSLSGGVLRIITENSAIASELRLTQIELVASIVKLLPVDMEIINKISIQIRTLEDYHG